MKEARRNVRAGLIGSSIQASRTPMMHMREGAAQRLDYSYEIFDLDLIREGQQALAYLLNQLELDGYAGVNITHPCKQNVIDLVTDLSPDARQIGAVNTVVFENGTRVATNTDWWGFAEGFRRGLPDVATGRVMVLGAGGAGAAVSFALSQLGAKEVIVSDIDPTKSKELVDRMSGNSTQSRFWATDDFSRDLESCDGLVHTTPTGMAKYPGIAFDPSILSQRHWVSEVVYVPLETELLKVAKAKGCRTLDGSGMAVFQAVRAFELFTGLAADPARMLRYFTEFAQTRAVV